jgi:hypothetical protein
MDLPLPELGEEAMSIRHFLLGALLASCAAACAGCMQIGAHFDTRKVAELEPGVSTEQDAIEKLGKPGSVSNLPDGTRLLEWQYDYATVLVAGSANAAILFGPDGRMIRIAHLDKQGL